MFAFLDSRHKVKCPFPCLLSVVPVGYPRQPEHTAESRQGQLPEFLAP